MTLSIHAKIVRTYANATRTVFGSLLEGDDAAAQIAKLLVGLAESTADCAEQMVEIQQAVEELGREAGINQARPKFRTIEGGKS